MNRDDSLLKQVRNELARLNWNQVDLACVVPFSPKTVQNWISERKPLNAPAREAFEDFLRQAERGDFDHQAGKVVSIEAAARPKRKPERRARRSYKTQFVARVHSTIDYAVENAAIALVTADFGAGKTQAAQLWRAANGDTQTIFFEFDEFTASRRYDFLSALASRLGLPDDVHSHNARRVFEEIVKQLRRDPAVLIFDQTEMVRVRVLQVLRQVWDRTRDEGTAVVLLGATPLAGRLQRGRGGDLGALISRIGVWINLAGFTREEMAAIVKAEGVGEVDGDALDLWFRAVNGSMRYLIETCDMLVSRHQGKRVTERTIADVCKRLLGLPVMTPPAVRRGGDGVLGARAATAEVS